MKYTKAQREKLIDEREKALRDYRFSAHEAKRIMRAVIAAAPLFYLADTIKSKLKNLEAYGFSRAEVRKMVLHLPSIFNLAKDSVNSKLENLESRGFSREEVRTMALGSSNVFSLAEESVNSKLRNLKKTRTFHNGFAMRFDAREARELVVSFPGTLGCSEQNMGRKVRVMAILAEGDKAEMLAMGKQWMQSARKTVARAEHLKECRAQWKHSNGIFMGAKPFEKRYGARL